MYVVILFIFIFNTKLNTYIYTHQAFGTSSSARVSSMFILGCAPGCLWHSWWHPFWLSRWYFQLVWLSAMDPFFLCVWDLALARGTISDPYFAQICLQPFLFSSPSRLVGRSHALSAASSSCFSLRHSPWSTHLGWFVFWASAGLYFLHQAGGGGFRLISLSGDSVHEQSGNRLVCSALWDIGIKDNIDIKDKNATDFWLFLAASYCCGGRQQQAGRPRSLLIGPSIWR